MAGKIARSDGDVTVDHFEECVDSIKPSLQHALERHRFRKSGAISTAQVNGGAPSLLVFGSSTITRTLTLALVIALYNSRRCCSRSFLN